MAEAQASRVEAADASVDAPLLGMPADGPLMSVDEGLAKAVRLLDQEILKECPAPL
jgi:hypothetical protein